MASFNAVVRELCRMALEVNNISKKVEYKNEKNRILYIIICSLFTIMFMGCGGSDSGGKDLTDAKSWDYDVDGKLNAKEREDYGNFLNDTYNYGK